MKKTNDKAVEKELVTPAPIETSEVDLVSGRPEVTRYAVYQNNALVKVFNGVTHGKDFVKLAKAYAERTEKKNPGMVCVAKEFTDPAIKATDKNVVNVVNVNGNVSRTFSLSTHGKEYKALAADFVKKHGKKKGLKLEA